MAAAGPCRTVVLVAAGGTAPPALKTGPTVLFLIPSDVSGFSMTRWTLSHKRNEKNIGILKPGQSLKK